MARAAPSLYFSLSRWVLLTEGVKYSSLFDTKTGGIYRVNKAGLSVLRRGFKEATVKEVAEASPAAAEFLREMARLGLIEFSDSPMDPPEPPRPPEPGLRLAWLELTSRCNLRCVHCYVEAGDARGEEMPTGEWARIISELAALGCGAIQLTGGRAAPKGRRPGASGAREERGHSDSRGLH